MARTYQEAVRNGTLAAGKLHRQIDLRALQEARPGAVDVFAVIADLGVPLMVRPLTGLLGAFLNLPSPGILVTTERPLSNQRFTAAHELGHCLLRHQPSLDDEDQILRRAPQVQDAGTGYQETEADAFAVAFLMPKWLIMAHCARQAWRLAELTRPDVVYQLALRLSGDQTVVLPDIRGYGQSLCRDPSLHTWRQYSSDVVALLDALGVTRAIVGGAGLGGTIALRTAVEHPERVQAVIAISLEDIEDNEAKLAEIRLMDDFAAQVRAEGISAAWEPLLKFLPPVIGAMVRDAIPRSDLESIAAAAAIGRDRSFRNPQELAAIRAPTLLIPGGDVRHPTALAEQVANIIPKGELAGVSMTEDMKSSVDFAEALRPSILDFIARVRTTAD